MAPSTKTAAAKQDGVRVEPDPAAQAAITDPKVDPAEQHIVEDTSPSGADLRSAEAPGIRTEPEVVAAHKAANERAARVAPHTADPAFSTSAVKYPSVEVRDEVVFFKPVNGAGDGTVQGVNVGTPEHARLLADTDFEVTTRPKADD